MGLRSFLALAAVLLFTGCVATRPDRPDSLASQAASNYSEVLLHTKLVPDPHAGWTDVYGRW